MSMEVANKKISKRKERINVNNPLASRYATMFILFLFAIRIYHDTAIE